MSLSAAHTLDIGLELEEATLSPHWSLPAELAANGSARVAVAGGGVVYAAGHEGTDFKVWRSADNGETWDAGTVVAAASGAYPMQYGGIRAEGNTVHVITAASDPGGDNAHLDYWRSTDGAANWSSAVRITGTGEEVRRANIDVAANGDLFVFAGRVNTAQDYGGAFVFRSTDDGANWTTTEVDSAANNAGGSPWGIVDGSNVHFAYARKFDSPSVYHHSYYVRSTDGGDNYSTPANIGEDVVEGGEARQRIALSGGSLVVSWTHSSKDIRGTRSTDDGATWATPYVFIEPPASEQFGHQEMRAIGGGRFFMTVSDETTADHDIYHAWSSDGGQTWTVPVLALEADPDSMQLGGFDAGDGWAHAITVDGDYSRRALSDIPTTITPALIESTAQVFEPTISEGAGGDTVSPALIESTAQVFEPTVQRGGVALIPALIASAAVVFAPTVAAGAEVIEPALIASTAEVFAPTVQPGAVQVAPSFISSTAVVFEPTVSEGVEGVAIQPALIASTATVFEPTVQPGAVAVQPGLIASTAEVFEPVVSEGTAGDVVQPAFIASTAEVFEPTVTEAGDLYTASLAGLAGNPATGFAFSWFFGDWNFQARTSDVRSFSSTGGSGGVEWLEPPHVIDAVAEARFAAVATGSKPRVVLRGSGTDTFLGYSARMDRLGSTFDLIRNGTVIATMAYSSGSGQRRIKLEVVEDAVADSTHVRAKVWLNSGTEPVDWMLEFEDTDAGRPTEGWIGLAGTNNNIDWFEVEAEVYQAAAAPPAQPSLTAEALDADTARLTLTASDGDDYELYQDDVLIESWTAATIPATHDIDGLTPTEDYEWVLKALNDDGSTDSDPAVLTMPGFGDEPGVRVGSITETSAELTSEDLAAEAINVRYRTTTLAGAAVDDTTLPVDGETPHPLTGLADGTVYVTEAAQEYPEGWSDFGEAVTWQTLSDDPAPAFASEFTDPPYAGILSGTAELTWDLDDGRSVVSAEISDDLGDTYSALSGPTATGVSFDTTAFDRGFYLARITLDNGDVIRHPGFVIDNSGEVIGGEAEDFNYGKWLSPDATLVSIGSCADARGIGHKGGGSGIVSDIRTASFGPVDPEVLAFHRRAFFAAEMASWGFAGGVFGTGPRSAEGTALVLTVASKLTGADDDDPETYFGIRAGIDIFQLSNGTTSTSPDQAGVGWGLFRLSTGFMGTPANSSFASTGEEFRAEIPVAMSIYFPYCLFRPFRLFIELERPDPVGTPRVLNIDAYCESPNPQTQLGDKRFAINIKQQVTLPSDLDCGHLAFVDEKVASHYGEYSRRTTHRFAAWADIGSCGSPADAGEEVPDACPPAAGTVRTISPFARDERPAPVCPPTGYPQIVI